MIDIEEQVTQLLPTPVATPSVSGYMQPHYDMKLAMKLAEMFPGVTAWDLIERCKQAEQEVKRG